MIAKKAAEWELMNICPKCRICASPTLFFAKATILNKYEVSYFRCGTCGFMQTEEPFWHQESCAEAINSTDVGLVSRNFAAAKVSKAIISAFFDTNGSFVDYGGGYGMFVRLMRDRGFDFYWFDEHCINLFAQGLKHQPGQSGTYEILTAFEVFEHLTDPLAEISKMLHLSKNILFTTKLIPDNPPVPGDWWYYGLEHGQHISFFTVRSFRIIARKFGLYFYTNGQSWHLLSEKKISQPLFNIISRYKAAAFLDLFQRRPSLASLDYQKAVSRSRQQG